MTPARVRAAPDLAPTDPVYYAAWHEGLGGSFR